MLDTFLHWLLTVATVDVPQVGGWIAVGVADVAHHLSTGWIGHRL